MTGTRRRHRPVGAAGLDAVLSAVQPQPLDVADEATAAVDAGDAENPGAYIAAKLRDGSLTPAISDVDAPKTGRAPSCCGGPICSDPPPRKRVLPANLLGTHHNVLGSENPNAPRPKDVAWHDDPPEGKLDLLLSADFRMTSTTLLGRRAARGHLVREARSVVDGHAPYVHAFSPAINPRGRRNRLRPVPPAGRSAVGTRPYPSGCAQDLECAGAARHPGRDGAATRSRHGLAGRKHPIRPGSNAPNFVVAERDYTAIADKLAAVGPLADKLGFTVKNVTFDLTEQTGKLAQENG